MCKVRPAIEHKQLTISKQREGVSARMCEIKKSIKNFRIQISGFAGRYYQNFPHARPLISEKKKTGRAPTNPHSKPYDFYEMTKDIDRLTFENNTI